MRICLISREYPPETGFGGIASYTFQHAHALRELGHEVEVIALAAPDDNRKQIPTHDDKGVIVHRVAYDELAHLSMIRSSTPFTHYVLSAAYALAKKFGALHLKKRFDVAESPEHLAEGLVPALCKNVPLVIRLHTPQSKLIAEKFHNVVPSFDQQFVAMIERIAMLNCDVITSPSLDMARYVSGDVGIPLEQIEVIYNPADEKRFAPNGKKPSESGEPPVVLAINRLEPRKGVGYLIDAVPEIVKHVPSAKFVIVGKDTMNAENQTSTQSELLEKLRRNGLAERVTFTPHVALEQLPEYYRSADVFVIPSLYDNAPMTCLEAMASGTPVVATDAGGAKEYATHGECGLIVPAANSAALADAIVQLLQNPAERKRIAKNARARIEGSLTRGAVAEQTVRAYHKAIAKHQQDRECALYRFDDERFTRDLDAFIGSYERMLYDFLYTQSFMFRLKHRVRKLFKRFS